MNANLTAPRHRAVAIWLLVCCALVFAMILLGGVTRLTGSGLSMVDWRPITGVLPPLSETEWEATFGLYQQSPEFRQRNYQMDIDGFKAIFWLEYLHRLLGRLLGLVFLVPFLIFWATGRIKPRETPKYLLMFMLGGLQGLLGWYMVKSGLVDNPHVSQYRLTAHLVLAISIYAFMFWVALGFLSRAGPAPRHRLYPPTVALTGLVVITILSGGFVAGLKAGLAFNTFPLMGGRLIPAGMLAHEPWWRNLFENIIAVQFNHRVLAVTTFVMVVAYWLRARRHALPSAVGVGVLLLLLTAIAQVSLGISTLLLKVPVPLAAAHQATAIVLFTVVLFVCHRLKGGGTQDLL